MDRENLNESARHKINKDIDGERRESILSDEESRGQDFLKSIGISFKNLSAVEQVCLLQFLGSKKMDAEDELREFLILHKEDGLRSFISLEQDGRNGEIVLDLAEKLGEERASFVLHKYAQIVEQSEKINKFFEERWPQYPVSGILQAKNDIVRGARNLLHAIDKILSEPQEEKNSDNVSDLLRELDKAQTETLLFKEVVKILTEELPWFDIQSTGGAIDFEIARAAEISKDRELVETMKKIYKENYKDYPEKFSEGLLRSFDARLRDPQVFLYMLRDNLNDKKLVSFCTCKTESVQRGEKTENTHISFASFNTAPEYQKARIGYVLLDQMLMEEGSSGLPILAECDPRAPITKKYIEHGFVAKNVHDHDGIPVFEIELNDAVNGGLRSKKFSTEEIVKKAGVKSNEGLIIREYKENEQPDFSLLQQGYVLTRYFVEKADKANSVTYCVFEKIAKTEKTTAQAA